MKSNSKNKLTAYVLASLLLIASVSTGYAFVPGESAIIVKTMWTIHGIEQQSATQHWTQEILTLKQQLEHAIGEAKNFRETVTGTWKNPLQVLQDSKSRVVAMGADLNNIGWQPTDEIVKSPVLRRAEDAMAVLNATARGDRQADGRQLRSSLEDLYEVSNATRTGGRSEAALHDMAEALTFLGKANKQIKEQQDIIDQTAQMIQQGGLTADEVQRLSVLSQTAHNRVQGIQLQAQLQTTRLQVNQLGIQVAAANQRDRDNLDERANRVNSLNALQFAPGLPTVGSLSRQ